MADSASATLKTTQVYDNEIVKAADYNFAFESIVGNIQLLSKMILDPTNSFVIGGKVVVDSGMNVKVNPVFGISTANSIPFGMTEESDLIAIDTDESNDRIDIIEAKGEWLDYYTEQRGFNDQDLNVVTYQDVDIRKRIKVTYKVVQGSVNSGVAPSVESGYVKLCEIHYSAGSTELYDEDIYNITADVAGMENENWTTDKTSVYNVGYINEVNSKFRTEHSVDGTHASGIIHKAQLDLGLSSTQCNADVFPILTSATLGGSSYSSGESINAALVKIATQITNLYSSYLKYGEYGFKGSLKISDSASENTLSDPLSITVSGSDDDRKAVISFNGIDVLTVSHNGLITVNSDYSPTADKNIATHGEVNNAISTAENLENATGTLAVAHGGTGGTTDKEAQYNLLESMNSDTTDATDESVMVCAYASGSATTGSIFKRTFSNLWNYIKTKVLGICDAAISLTSTNPIQNSAVTSSMATAVASNAVGDAKTVSVSGFSLVNGATLKVLFINGHTSSTSADAFTLKVNDNDAKTIYVNQNGSVIQLYGHTISSVNWFVQAYTTLELIYLTSLNDGAGGFLVLGNPEVLSSNSGTSGYTVKANGLIEQFGISYSSTVTFSISFKDSNYGLSFEQPRSGSTNDGYHWYRDKTTSYFIPLATDITPISYYVIGY